MDTLSLDQAKLQLESLIARAARGEDVRISHPEFGTTRLVVEAHPPPTPRRAPGRWKGRIHVPEDQLLAPLDPAELAWLGGERAAGYSNG